MLHDGSPCWPRGLPCPPRPMPWFWIPRGQYRVTLLYSWTTWCRPHSRHWARLQQAGKGGPEAPRDSWPATDSDHQLGPSDQGWRGWQGSPWANPTTCWAMGRLQSCNCHYQLGQVLGLWAAQAICHAHGGTPNQRPLQRPRYASSEKLPYEVLWWEGKGIHPRGGLRQDRRPSHLSQPCREIREHDCQMRPHLWNGKDLVLEQLCHSRRGNGRRCHGSTKVCGMSCSAMALAVWY